MFSLLLLLLGLEVWEWEWERSSKEVASWRVLKMSAAPLGSMFDWVREVRKCRGGVMVVVREFGRSRGFGLSLSCDGFGDVVLLVFALGGGECASRSAVYFSKR